MASHGEDDLVASKTEGFKVGEKKTVEEYAKLGETLYFHFEMLVLLASIPISRVRRRLPAAIQQSSWKASEMMLEPDT